MATFRVLSQTSIFLVFVGGLDNIERRAATQRQNIAVMQRVERSLCEHANSVSSRL